MTQEIAASPPPGLNDQDWPAAFLSDADKLDLPLLLSWFADDIDLRIANMPPVIGIAAVEKAFADFWSNLSDMSHKREAIVMEGAAGTQLSIVTYTRKDGKAVSMPVASYIRRNADGRFNRLWIYIDINPLFAEG